MAESTTTANTLSLSPNEVILNQLATSQITLISNKTFQSFVATKRNFQSFTVGQTGESHVPPSLQIPGLRDRSNFL